APAAQAAAAVRVPVAADTACGAFLQDPAEVPTGLPAALQPYAEDLHRAAANIAGHLRREPVRKWAVCLKATSAVETAVVRDADGSMSGTADHCVVTYNADAIASARTGD